MGDSVDFCIADVVSQYDAIDPEVEGVVDPATQVLQAFKVRIDDADEGRRREGRSDD